MGTKKAQGNSNGRTTRRRLAVGLATVAAAALATVLPAAPASAATPPTTERVSVTLGNGQASNGGFGNTIVTADGRYAFFTSRFVFVAADTNATDDVYRHDRISGKTIRVSFWGDDSQVPYASRLSSVSANGRFVVFQTMGQPNPAPTVFENQLWRRDIVDQTTRMVTIDDGNKAIGGAATTRSSITPDGQRVAFTSKASNWGTGGHDQIFLRRFDLDDMLMLSISDAGKEGNDDSSSPDISATGDVVAFGSDATNLVAGDTNGVGDAFTRKLSTNATKRVSTTPTGKQLKAQSQAATISDTGRYVAFSSSDDKLDGDDPNATSDIFRKDTTNNNVVRVSVAPNGTGANGYSTLPEITGDGRFVAFISDAWDLYPADINGTTDVFRRDIQLGRTDLVSRRYTGIAVGNKFSVTWPSISADGRVVGFTSFATNLVANDTNNTQDNFVRDFNPDAQQ